MTRAAHFAEEPRPGEIPQCVGTKGLVDGDYSLQAPHPPQIAAVAVDSALVHVSANSSQTHHAGASPVYAVHERAPAD